MIPATKKPENMHIDFWESYYTIFVLEKHYTIILL